MVQTYLGDTSEDEAPQHDVHLGNVVAEPGPAVAQRSGRIDPRRKRARAAANTYGHDAAADANPGSRVQASESPASAAAAAGGGQRPTVSPVDSGSQQSGAGGKAGSKRARQAAGGGEDAAGKAQAGPSSKRTRQQAATDTAPQHAAAGQPQRNAALEQQQKQQQPKQQQQQEQQEQEQPLSKKARKRAKQAAAAAAAAAVAAAAAPQSPPAAVDDLLDIIGFPDVNMQGEEGAPAASPPTKAPSKAPADPVQPIAAAAAPAAAADNNDDDAGPDGAVSLDKLCRACAAAAVGWQLPAPREVALPQPPSCQGAAATYPDLLQAAVARHAGGGTGVAPPAAAGSQLHQEVVGFAARCLPSPAELEGGAALVALLQQLVTKRWGGSPQVVPFGSQPTGLALPGSDMDLAILDVPHCPRPLDAAGYKGQERVAVSKLLRDLRKGLATAGLIRSEYDLELVAHARVPLLKGQLSIELPADPYYTGQRGQGQAGGQQQQGQGQPVVVAQGAFQSRRRFHQQRHQQEGAGEREWRPRGRVFSMKVDICLGVANGPSAVKFVVDQVRALPPLRPLVLAVKALLKEASLNEVFSGGISSYALMTLMAAHLQAEGAAPPYLSASVPAEAALASPGSGAGSEEAEQQQSDEDEDEDEDEWEEEEEAEEEEEEQEEGMATSSSSSSSAEEPASMEEGEAAPGDTQQQQNSSRASRRRARAAAAAAAADDDSDVDEQQQEPQLLHPQDVLQHLRDLVTLPASASEAPGWEAGGTWDYGVLLQGFFRRYGSLMDYVMEAVALSRGGVSPKPQPWQGRGQWKGSPALAVQDPQQHGRNITPYTHMRLSLLQQTFAWAEKALAAAADQYAPSFNGVAPPPQQQQQQQGREDLGVIGAGGRRAAHQLYQQQLQQGARAATWADVQADGQHRSQAATGQAAAAPQSWEAKQAAALHRQMPVLGEVVSLWAAVGKGPGADQLRGELRDAAMLMQERLDNKEVPKGVRKIRAKMALILKKRAAAGQRGKLRSAGASNGAAAGGFKKTKKQKKKDKQAKQQKKQKKQEKQAKKQARKQK